MKRDGLGLVAVSYDSPEILADFAGRRGITFPLLSDTGSAVIKQYGILNTTVQRDNPVYGIPFPGTFILDANGVVTSKIFENAYQERDTMASVLARLGARLDVPATKQSAPHVTFTAYATDQTAAPGTHFSVVVDVVPDGRVHVYAPGVSGYKPVAVAVQPQPGLIIRESRLPKPEEYVFEPLNEHVLVYQKPFRIVQDLEIDPSPDAAAVLKDRTTMTIAGAFEYQACDDKECFTPQSVPLTWTIGLRALDRERVQKR